MDAKELIIGTMVFMFVLFGFMYFSISSLNPGISLPTQYENLTFSSEYNTVVDDSVTEADEYFNKTGDLNAAPSNTVQLIQTWKGRFNNVRLLLKNVFDVFGWSSIIVGFFLAVLFVFLLFIMIEALVKFFGGLFGGGT